MAVLKKGGSIYSGDQINKLWFHCMGEYYKVIEKKDIVAVHHTDECQNVERRNLSIL